MPRELPGVKEIRDLLEELLGRTIVVHPADPVRATDVPRSLLALYVDDTLRMAGVVGMDFPLTVHSAAAIGLVPPGSARACIADAELPPMLGENAAEICNVLSSLLNNHGQQHVRLHQTYLPGEPAPSDVVAQLLALGNRLDVIIDINGYGKGRLSLSFGGAAR